ncbi:MAG: hypothetical protein WCO94_17200, partial [Verrucomicrobiota bacterium]
MNNTPGIFLGLIDTAAFEKRFMPPSQRSSPDGSDGSDGSSRSPRPQRVIFPLTTEKCQKQPKTPSTDGTDVFPKPSRVREKKKLRASALAKNNFLSQPDATRNPSVASELPKVETSLERFPEIATAITAAGSVALDIET